MGQYLHKRMKSLRLKSTFAIVLLGKNINFIFVIDLLLLNVNHYAKAEPEPEQECHFSKLQPGNRLFADCTDLKLKEVPSNLDSNIQVLDLSKNLNLNLKANSFQKYTELIEIRITELYRDTKATVSATTFLPLKKLEILIMDHVFYDSTDFQWPVSLKTLSLNNNNYKELNVSYLNVLENLYLKENLFDTLPIVHESAPIKILFLSSNPLNKLTAESLANFCVLEYINLELAGDSNLNTERSNYCQCLRVETWLKQRNINGTQPLHCLSPPKPDCNLEFNEAAANFEECLIQHGKLARKISFKLLVGVVIVFAILIIILVFLIRRHKRAKSQPSSESAPVADSESPSEVSPKNEIDKESADEEESHHDEMNEGHEGSEE